MKTYSAAISQESLSRVEGYLADLKSNVVQPGAYLARGLQGVDIAELSTSAFLEILLNTKQPQIFAESAVSGDGQDWTQIELSLLGDVSFIVPVTVFDDGAHQAPLVHDTPFPATLLFTAGALLRNDQGGAPVDWVETHKDGVFDMGRYISLYRRRLIPVLHWVNADAQVTGRKALITVPGLGCGQFAGPYRGQLGARLETALKQIVSEASAQLPNIQAVWYDPYDECELSKETLGHIEFFARPLAKDLLPRPQLTAPKLFGFEDCHLNDYYVGSRATDDGVKAAATDTMRTMTGEEGSYDARQKKYLPPQDCYDWNEVVRRGNIKLAVEGALFVA